MAGGRRFVSERFGLNLSRSSCLNYLHRLGFALKRPKKRLVKANESKRQAFVAEHAALRETAQRTGAKVFSAGEAHFQAEAELRGKWVLRGEPALVNSTSPKYGEKASYYSAVCLETGEVEWMGLEGNSNSGTSVAFLEQLRRRHSGRLNVIWDNAPAHHGEALREYLRTPELDLRLVNLAGYSPDFNADEAIWGWAGEEATGNLCLGSRAAVHEKVGGFLAGLANRQDEVRRRCPDSAAIKGRGIPPRPHARFQPSRKCTSHLGVSLVCDGYPGLARLRRTAGRLAGGERHDAEQGGTFPGHGRVAVQRRRGRRPHRGVLRCRRSQPRADDLDLDEGRDHILPGEGPHSERPPTLDQLPGPAGSQGDAGRDSEGRPDHRRSVGPDQSIGARHGRRAGGVVAIFPPAAIDIGEVAVVGPADPVDGQLNDGGRSSPGDGVVGPSPPFPVSECGDALPAVSGEEALGMTFTHSHDLAARAMGSWYSRTLFST